MKIRKRNNYQVPTVHKAISILELLKETPNLTLIEISNKLNISTSTCYNILCTLEDRGFVIRNKSLGYELGNHLMHLGLTIYHRNDLRSVAKPYMDKLSEDFTETSYLSILDKSTMEGIVIERVQSSKSKLMYLRNVGEKFPLYASGTGKSLLSGLDNEELDEYFKKVPLVRFTENTLDEQRLRKEIEEIRTNGYAKAISELEIGVVSISSPIKDSSNNVVAAISLAGPDIRLLKHLPQIINSVKSSALEISLALGYKAINS